MGASITLRPTYAIGIIIDNSLGLKDLTKIGNIFDFVLNNQNENNADTNDYTLKNIPSEIKIHIYVAVARSVPDQIVDRIKEKIAVETSPNNIRTLWFGDGIDRTRAELEQRLIQWIGENGASKTWIIDPNSDTMGDLLTKFK